MKGIPLSSLVPGTYFDEPVYLDANYILLTPDSPVTPELVKRLQKWKYLQVCDGRQGQGRARLPLQGEHGEHVARRPSTRISSRTPQVAAAQKFHAEFTAFTDGLFAKYTLESLLNLGQVTEWIKKAIQIVHESRDFLLRFLDVERRG